MTVSTTTDYTETRATFIRDALLQLRVIDVDEDVTGKMGEFMNRQLNRLVKAWQGYGINLWKKDTGIIFLDPSVGEYHLSLASTQHATDEDYKFTTLSAAAASGVSVISVTSTTNMVVGDNIGIVLDDNTRFWTTIDSIGSGTVDFTPDTLPSDAANGNRVVFYTNKVDTPFDVLSINRLRVNQGFRNEVPLTYLSYQDFFELPNKESVSVPTMYNYDPQLNEAIIRIWPLPSDFTYDLSFTFEKTFFDFDTAADSPDFPQEWYDALVLNLAIRSASVFGKNVGSSYQNLKIEATNALTLANSNDNEEGSIFIQPSNGGQS